MGEGYDIAALREVASDADSRNGKRRRAHAPRFARLKAKGAPAVDSLSLRPRSTKARSNSLTPSLPSARGALLCALLILCSAPTAAAEPLSSSRFELADNIPIVDVWIDGKGPFAFAVDSGAAWMVLSPQLANQLNLRPTGFRNVSGGGPEFDARAERNARCASYRATRRNANAGVRGSAAAGTV